MSPIYHARKKPPTRTRTMALATMAVVAAVVAAACSDAGSADVSVEGDDRFDLSGQTLRIGTAAEQTLDIGTSYALELLKGWGAEVEREELTDVSGLEAIVAGRTDVTGRSSDEVIDGQARGVDVVAFGGPASAMHYVIISADDVPDVAALRGRSIAISGPGGFDTILFEALLRQDGLDPEADVQQIPIGGSGERTSAVLAGQADAAMVFLDNWIALEEQTDDVGLLGYVAELLPGLSSRTLAAERGFIEQNDELILAMACANLEANAWISEDPDGFVDFTTSRVTGVTEENVRAFLAEAAELGMFPTQPEEILSADAYQRTAELMAAADLVDDVDVESMVDVSFLQEAAEMGCGQGTGGAGG